MLILTLSCSVYAGDMQNGVTGTTNTAQGVMQTGIDGEMQTGVNSTSSQTTTSALEGAKITFSLVQSLLGLF
jgi:hypothetical protein